MSTWLKRLLVGGLILLVLLGVGAGVFLATIDQQAYKSWLQEQVRERYGRTLDIKGDVGIRVFPEIGLRVNDVMLSEPHSAERFASIKQLNVSVAIRPLLQRQVSIQEVTLDGLDVKLRRDRQGKWNFNDLMGPGRHQTLADSKKEGGATAGSPPPSTPMTIDIHKLDLKQSTVTVFDQSKSWITAQNLNASVSRASARGEYDLMVSSAIDVREEGQADVSIKSRIGWNDDGSQLTANSAEIKLTKGQQHAKQGLRQVDVVVGLNNLVVKPSSDHVSGSGFTMKAKGLQGADRFEWTADMASLQVERSVGTVPALSGRLRLDGTNAMDAKYQVSGLSFKPGLIDMRLAKLDLGVKQANRLYRFDAEMPIAIKARKTVQATAVKGVFQLADPSLPAGGINLPVAGKLGYDLEKQVASWELTTSFLDSPIDFSGQATSLDKAVPRVSAKLNTTVLDLNAIHAFLNQPKPAVKSGAAGGAAKTAANDKTAPATDLGAIAPATPSAAVAAAALAAPAASTASVAPASAAPPTDISWMRKLDLDLQIRAARFQWQKVQASQLQLQVDVQQGKVQLRSIQAALYGGTLNAEAGLVDTKGLPVFLKGKLNAVQVEPLITALTGESMLGGVGAMSFDLKASAIDSTQLLKSLDGQSQLDIKQGYVKGMDLNKGVDALSDPAGRAKDLPLAMDMSKRTNLSVMQTQILFGDGLARLQKLNLSSNNLRITEGKIAQIGLLDGALNVLTDVQFTGNIGVPGARVAIQVRSLVVPLHIGGTLQSPEVRVHWQSMPEDALKQSLQQLLLQGIIGGKDGFVGVGKTNPAAPADSGPEAKPGAAPNPAIQLENVIRGLFGR